MSVIFYTALFGQHTDLKEFDRKGFQCFCFTDDPELTSNTWTIIQQPRVGTPRMDAKWPKMNPDTLGLPLAYGDYTIWVDASIQITDIEEMARVCARGDLALFAHPERTNIFEEAGASAVMPKYAGMPLVEQALAYNADGLPTDHRLWAGGVIARRVDHHHKNISFGLKWYHECRRWSPQDQISLPYVLFKLGIKPTVIEGSIYETPYMKHIWTGPSDDADPHGRAFFGQMRMCRDPYRRLGDAIHKVVGPEESALDIGCGIGLQTKRLKELGWNIIGAEHAPVAVDMREPGVDIVSFDLTAPFGGHIPGTVYDCVICTETAEHIPAEHAEQIVENVAGYATKTIIWSAAQPEQPWPGHVNLQRPAYWIEKFERRGWRVDEDETQWLRKIMISTEAQHWRAASNFHIFVRA